MNGLMDPSPKDVKNMELVRKMKSKFESPSFTTTKINSKFLFNSQDKTDFGQQNKHANFEELISVNFKSRTEMQSQITKICTKLADIENRFVAHSKETAKKMDELKTSFESNFSELIDKLNELRLDNKIIIQVLFDLDKNVNARSVQSEVGEEQLGANEEDNEKLEADENYIRETLKKIEEVDANLDEQENRARSFSGSKEDLIYLDVEHKVLENVMKIDLIQSHENEEIREKKRSVLERSEKIKEILDSHLISSE